MPNTSPPTGDRDRLISGFELSTEEGKQIHAEQSKDQMPRDRRAIVADDPNEREMQKKRKSNHSARKIASR